jgi:hypothetical protein
MMRHRQAAFRPYPPPALNPYAGRRRCDGSPFLTNATLIQLRSEVPKTRSHAMPYNLSTKTAQSSGPENIGPERPHTVILAPLSVLSLSRITPENNGKILPQPERENEFERASGGAGARHGDDALLFDQMHGGGLIR